MVRTPLQVQMLYPDGNCETMTAEAAAEQMADAIRDDYSNKRWGGIFRDFDPSCVLAELQETQIGVFIDLSLNLHPDPNETRGDCPECMGQLSCETCGRKMLGYETASWRLFEKVDWRQLREQKRQLLQIMNTFEGPWMKQLYGIIHLIDHIQDTAAGEYGIREVFEEDKPDG